MTTVAMNNLWNYIQGLSLSRRNQAWLAERLLNASKQEKKVKTDPTEMTKEEFFARIEEASKGPVFRCSGVEELDKIIRESV